MSRQPKQFPSTQKYKPKPEIDTAFLPPKITCRKCNKSLPHDAFTHYRLSHKDFVCKTCYNKQAKKYQKIYKHNNKAKNKLNISNDQTPEDITPLYRCDLCKCTYTNHLHPQLCPQCIDSLTYGILNDPYEYPKCYLIININHKTHIPTLQCIPILPPYRLPGKPFMDSATHEPIKISSTTFALPDDETILKLLGEPYKQCSIIRKTHRIEVRVIY